MSDRRSEVDAKVARVAALLDGEGLDAVVIALQPNFAWLSAGGSNAIDGSREDGAGALLVTRGGRRFVLANAIEHGRLVDEELAGLGFEPLPPFPWHAPLAGGRAVLEAAASVLPADAKVGADSPVAGTRVIDAAIARLRWQLTDSEQQRLAALCVDTAATIEGVCRLVRPGSSERSWRRA